MSTQNQNEVQQQQYGKICGIGQFGCVYMASPNQTENVVKVMDLFEFSVDNLGYRIVQQSLREACFYKIIQKQLLGHPRFLQATSVTISEQCMPQPDIGLHQHDISIKMSFGGLELLKQDSHSMTNRFSSARKVWLQLCEAVITLHDSGISHGDIKSENILLDHECNLSLIDFGGIHFPSDDFEVMMIDRSKRNDVWAMGLVMLEYLCDIRWDKLLPADPSDHLYWMQCVQQIVKESISINKLDSELKRIFEYIIPMLHTGPLKRPTVREIYHGIYNGNKECESTFPKGEMFLPFCNQVGQYDPAKLKLQCVDKYFKNKNSPKNHDHVIVGRVCDLIVDSLFFDRTHGMAMSIEEQALAVDILNVLDFDLFSRIE